MNKTTFKTLALIFLMQAIALSTNAQDPQKAKMTPDGRGYLEYLPASYANSTEQYPVIIFLHGSGERGTGTPADLAKVTANGPPKHIKNGNTMCFTVNGKTECFIVLSPQTNKWSWKYEVVPFVKYALANYRIDPTRVYLTGLSMGGEGTWFGAAMEDNIPNLFAAIAPMCGRASTTDGKNVASKKVAVWGFHGDADTAIPLESGQKPITGMILAHADPAPIFTIYPGGGHSTAWDRGYRTDHSYHTPNVYEWFLSQRLPVAAPAPPANIAPVVNAGADQTITLPATQASLTATASDTDGTIATYQWTKTSGPAATLTNATTQTLSVTNLNATGTYVFSVTVTDNQGSAATDQVTVIVNSGTNQAPTVNAGADQSTTLPVTQLSVTATANDTDGTISTYKWTKTSGPGATMSGSSSPTVSLANITSTGTIALTVTVTDNLGATATDQMTIQVTASTPNVAPNVNAGADVNITLPVSQVTLTANASDTDGTIATYAWTMTSGPGATLSNASTSSLSVANLVAGTYTFSVTVSDNKGATASDQVTVVVNPAPVNQAPVVEAGEKQIITLPTNTASFTAIASDADGTIASYSWKKIGGSSTITMVGTTTPTLSVSNVIASTYVFLIEVTDNNGLKDTDTVRLKVNPPVTTTTTFARVSTELAVNESTGEYELGLGQNYPNPVSTSTTIPFTVDTDQRVMIKLYNSTGYEVATIIDEQVSAGIHEVQFNADVLRNTTNAANAVYYYKLIANGKVITKQLVIL
jgi:hypothetical protein